MTKCCCKSVPSTSNVKYQKQRPWIGVDFDGTLAHYDGWKGYEHVGLPIKPMCDRVRAWLEYGKLVKIFTARVHGQHGEALGKVSSPIWKFCQREFGITLEITCVKDPAMIELWDDRAVQVFTNTGKTHNDYE